MKNRILRTLTVALLIALALYFFFFSKTPKGTFVNASSFSEKNKITLQRIELGRDLFFDKRLSSNDRVSCATCHNPEFAFTDRKKLSIGVNGQMTQRNSPSLLNAIDLKTMMFDAHIPSLEQQVLVPIQEHTEMNMKMSALITKLRSIPKYYKAARMLYQREFDPYVLTRSIAAFERTLISRNSKYDRYVRGDKKALSNEEKQGYRLFLNKLYCAKCHTPPNFTNYSAENNGLYSDFSKDMGRFRIFGDSSDIGKFKVPSLRNVEVTYPYMHDGSISDLEKVIDHYSKGGSRHFNQSEMIKAFSITEKDKKSLIAFLKSLTDTSYMDDF